MVQSQPRIFTWLCSPRWCSYTVIYRPDAPNTSNMSYTSAWSPASCGGVAALLAEARNWSPDTIISNSIIRPSSNNVAHLIALGGGLNLLLRAPHRLAPWRTPFNTHHDTARPLLPRCRPSGAPARPRYVSQTLSVQHSLPRGASEVCSHLRRYVTRGAIGAGLVCRGCRVITAHLHRLDALARQWSIHYNDAMRGRTPSHQSSLKAKVHGGTSHGSCRLD